MMGLDWWYADTLLYLATCASPEGYTTDQVLQTGLCKPPDRRRNYGETASEPC